MNLDQLAYRFARKQNTITLIFNHASTAELQGYKQDDADQENLKFCEYEPDILGVEYEDVKDENGKVIGQIKGQVNYKNMFF